MNSGGDRAPEKRSRELETEEVETEENQDLVHKAKRRASVCLQVDETTKHTHEEQKKALQEELQKPKPSKSKVKKLMEETSAGRMQWMDQELPMVEEILSEYPPLRSGKMVSTFRSLLQIQRCI